MTSHTSASAARAVPPVLLAGVLAGAVAGVLVVLVGDRALSAGVIGACALVGVVVALVLLPGRLRRGRDEAVAARLLGTLDAGSRATAVRAARRGRVPADEATRLAALGLARARLADRAQGLAWSRGVTGAAVVAAVVLVVAVGPGWWPLPAVLVLGLVADELGRVRRGRRVRAVQR